MANETGRRKGRRTNRWRMAGWSLAALLLALPPIAMMSGEAVAWTRSDFAFAAAMIGGVGVLFKLAARYSRSALYRLGSPVALGAGFMLVWSSLAVGIIGDEGNPANLMYAGVLAVAVAGTFVARAAPAGMARAMTAAAAAQSLAAAVAFGYGLGAAEPPGRLGILAINGCFTLLWLVAALLFRKAAPEAGG